MNLSFYSSAINAKAQQEKLNVIANNVANLNTPGFKKSDTVFTDLFYQNIRSQNDPEDTTLKNGSGAKLQGVNTDFTPAGILPTGGANDFYISGDGFFAIRTNTGEINYTRDGSFYVSEGLDGKLYLRHSSSGGALLDANGNPVEKLQGEGEYNFAVYTFANKEGFVSKGGNLYEVTERSGEPILTNNVKVEQGMLEMSNADLSEEFSKMIVAQRAYQMNLKMITASDEITQEINQLRR